MSGFGELPDELEHRDDEYRLDELETSPQPFFYTADQLQLKVWPASRQCHGALQLLRELITEHDLSLDEIDRITLGLPAFYLKPHMFEPSPETYWEAIYSVQWAAALAILDVEPGPEWFTEERLANPVVRQLAPILQAWRATSSRPVEKGPLTWDDECLRAPVSYTGVSPAG